MGDYERLFEQLPVPMWFIDAASMKVVRANHAAARMLGEHAKHCHGLTLNALRDRLEARQNGRRLPFKVLRNSDSLPFSLDGDSVVVGICSLKEDD